MTTAILTDRLERFMEKVDTSAGSDACWPWTGARDKDGYGKFQIDHRTGMRAPRWLLGHLRGELLTSQEQALHHCDLASCCNPTHLYIGTASDNSRDTVARNPRSIIALKRAQTHCKHGHEFTSETTRIRRGTGYRQCRVCERESQARFFARRRAAAAS